MRFFFGFKTVIFVALFCLATGVQVSAQVLRVAVAANAQTLIRKLQADFYKKSGIKMEAIIGASGKLTAQIMNGAPYDVFLSADTEFPGQLNAKGFGLQNPKIYALGSLIICGNTTLELKNWANTVMDAKVVKLAIANPKTAPYGRAAEEALIYYKLVDKVKPKLVYAESISQVNTYIQADAVSLGFTTESFLYDNIDHAKLKWSRVDPKSYQKIEQGAILLTHAGKGMLKEATEFFNYLSSPSARNIIRKSGYHLPQLNKN